MSLWWLGVGLYVAIGFIGQMAAYLYDDSPSDADGKGLILVFFGIVWPLGLIMGLGIGAGWLYAKGPEAAATKIRELKTDYQESRRAKRREASTEAGAVSLSEHVGGEVSLS